MGGEGLVPRPPAPPELDVVALRTQLEGTQLLDALRLHRVGMSRPCLARARPTCCSLPLAQPSQPLLITCFSPAGKEFPSFRNFPFRNSSLFLFLLFAGVLSPSHASALWLLLQWSSPWNIHASGWTCTDHKHSPCRGERELCRRRSRGMSWVTRGAEVASGHLKLLSVPSPCPHCRGFSLMAAPHLPSTPMPFAVHRVSQQVPPHCASASGGALGLVQPPTALCAPRVLGSAAPHPVPQALPGAGPGGDEEAQLCLRGAR